MRMVLYTTMLVVAVLAVAPAYAYVDHAEIDKTEFGINDKFTISGTITDPNRVTLLASMKGPSNEQLTRTTISDHDTPTFSFIPVYAKELFDRRGEYTVNVFTELQRPEDGTKIKLQYSGSKITLLPDYTLELSRIGSKTITATQTLSFTAKVTDPAIRDEQFSLARAYPDGAMINPDTGKFQWTPNENQAGSYIFDVMVRAGPFEDWETIQITVFPVKKEIPEPPPRVQNPVEPPEIPAPFVEPGRDPYYYVDRYHNEQAYREWFDENYSQYSSIYEAAGVMEIPEGIGAWTGTAEGIVEAVPEPHILLVSQNAHGYCGDGTKLIAGICTIVVHQDKPWWQFW